MTQRDVNKIDKTIMDNFYKLVHSQQNVRLTAASSTFKILKALSKNKNSSTSFNDNLNYSVDRLVSGLASSRALARHGYGTLLLEILNNFQVSTERLFNIAQQRFGNISKETSLDNLLGYFLLISIVLESRNHERSKSNTQYLEKVYKILLQLHNTKSYLGYSVCKILVDYYEIFHPQLVESIPQHAFGSDSKLTILELLIITLCNKKEPVRELLSMDKSRLMNYCSLLLDEKFQKKPLHPIFLEVSLMIIKHFSDIFEKFYLEIIMPTFFKSNHNELASMGLELLASILNTTNDSEIIKIIFDKRIIRTIIISMRKRTSLSVHSQKFIDSLKDNFHQADKENNDNQFIILEKLTSPPGSLAFDEDSKSSSISDLLNKCSREVLGKYLNHLMLSLNGNSYGQDQARIQKACINQIAFIVARPQLTDDHETLIKICKLFMMHSLFKTKDGKILDESFFVQHKIPKIGEILESNLPSIKSAYHSILDQLVSICTPVQRIEQLEDLIKFADKLITMDSLKHIDCENVKPMWSEYMTYMKEYKKFLKKQNEPKEYNAVHTLFLFYGLQIVEFDLECKTQLEELSKCCQKEESWADILTDQLLAILSATECSAWIRKLCESVFGSLLGKISDTSIELICEAIKTPIDEEVDDEEEVEEDDNGEDSDISFAEDEDDQNSSTEDDIESIDVDMKDENNQEATVEVNNDIDLDNSDENDDDEEYLNDEQMMKLDTVIADMFKLNRIGKNKKKTEPAFQLRCLDLVKKIVMKKHNDVNTMNTILNTIIPLAIKSSKAKETKPISDKIIRMLGKMPGKARFPTITQFLESTKPK